jgi:magnesium-transporting ATPase (P-type)
VINLGIAFGAGLYESLIVIPGWFSTSPDSAVLWNAQAARLEDTEQHFWILVTTIPLSLLTLASLWEAWQSKGKIRTWWMTASVVALLERAFTFIYFIPTMMQLMQDQDTAQPEAAGIALQWVDLNYLRLAMLFLAWIAALRALSRSGGKQMFVRRYGPYK